MWNDNLFEGETILINFYSITMKFTDRLSGKIFHHTNIYGLAAPTERGFFISWVYNEMVLFNFLTHHFDLVDIAFEGRATLGVTCKIIHCWRNRTGFSLLPPGLFNTQIQQFCQ